MEGQEGSAEDSFLDLRFLIQTCKDINRRTFRGKEASSLKLETETMEGQLAQA